MRPFNHLNAKSLDEAIAALQKGDANVLAGGVDLALQLLHASLCLDGADAPGGLQRQTGGVIPAVFQCIKALQQDRGGLLGARKAYDSTHI